MKMVFISYSDPVDEEMMQLLEKCGIRSFTKCKDVLDQGESGDPRFGTHVWPGLNAALMMGVEDDQAEALLEEIRRFNAGLKHEKAKAFAWDLTAVV